MRQSWASSEATRASMRANRSKGTKPEMMLRSAIHRRGLRYRVNTPPIATLRRTADIVFTRAKVAVFVDGCFWHGCEEHYSLSKTNTEFWQAKLVSNRRRDAEINATLVDAGWIVMRIWEHEDFDLAVREICSVVQNRRRRDGP